ncbi:MAG: hypothetical protein A3F84_10390 [Candidatus Handelsmanbacteria bacterium RIFCSPLOWO2_12_FULL_64_10]|uniref:Uncharacterized protein n=1 Tax=Handelsmanbacteria sp. (strain RIFCSPLOWO2_12_FULL_64_10) TaxID=1817868 RepID=A0A1F6CB37_HANXR|nr:MAG: hypothetical protein A3F84_10390 [Candidatus Handelsmanbacteria bacterium RIFCSPLOWO2_12_FULL_64_10]
MDQPDHFERAFQRTLRNEGGWSDHAADKGGATMLGISLRFLRTLKDADRDGWLDGDLNLDGAVDEKDVRLVDEERVKRIARAYFWDPLRCGEIASFEAAARVFDLSFVMGGPSAARVLQSACARCGIPIEVDGVIGSQTLGAVNALARANEGAFLAALRERAAARFGEIIAGDPAQEAFRDGWMARARS